jgi:cytochrome c55X
MRGPTSVALTVALLAGAPLASAVDGQRQVELEHLIRHECGSCHGMTMKGGLGSSLLPADLEHLDRLSLARIILDGLPGTPMPPWRALLGEDDARWIAERLKEGLAP